MVQESWQTEINEDHEALAERKLVQATKDLQYLQQRQAARQAVLTSESPFMREQLQDKVCQYLRNIKFALDHQIKLLVVAASSGKGHNIPLAHRNYLKSAAVPEGVIIGYKIPPNNFALRKASLLRAEKVIVHGKAWENLKAFCRLANGFLRRGQLKRKTSQSFPQKKRAAPMPLLRLSPCKE